MSHVSLLHCCTGIETFADWADAHCDGTGKKEEMGCRVVSIKYGTILHAVADVSFFRFKARQRARTAG
jgi:hypothetical protein